MLFSKYNKLIDINYLQHHKEDSFFDRKSARVDLRSLSNIISSFANANGGLVVVGIEDNGDITGFKDIGDNKYNNFLKILSLSYFKSIPKCNIEIIEVNVSAIP